jgi:hypothetical protein
MPQGQRLVSHLYSGILLGGTPSTQSAQLQLLIVVILVVVGWIKELLLELAVLIVLPFFALRRLQVTTVPSGHRLFSAACSCYNDSI